MIEPFNPLQVQLTTYTLEYLQDIYDKYEKVAALRGINFPTTLKQAQASILTKNDFFFFKLLKDIDFNYSLDILSISDEWKKILDYIIKDTEIIFTADHLIIAGEKYSHDAEYNEFFPLQTDLLEFVAVSFISHKVGIVEHRTAQDPFKDQQVFNIAEAESFTGYKKSYLYKLKSDGYLKAWQTKEYGALRFRREDLVKLMFRKESTTIEDLI